MLDSRQANAIRKAVELGGPAKVQRVEFGTYLVPSATAPDVTHVITGQRLDGADLECDCSAGAWGRPCWHAAAVMVAKLEHAAGVRVLGPAPLPVSEQPAPVPTTRQAPRRQALV